MICYRSQRIRRLRIAALWAGRLSPAFGIRRAIHYLCKAPLNLSKSLLRTRRSNRWQPLRNARYDFLSFTANTAPAAATAAVNASVPDKLPPSFRCLFNLSSSISLIATPTATNTIAGILAQILL